MNNKNIGKWIIVHTFLMLFCSIYALYITSIPLPLFFVSLSFIALLYLNRFAFKQFQPYGGYANWVSLIRLLLLFLLLINNQVLSKHTLALGFLTCILMDGLDGWLARRYQQVSEWGGLFDKEIDSFLVWGISLILYIYWNFPIWIMGIGCLHYFYEIILFLLNWQDIKTPKNPVGRYVAAFLFFSLLAPFILPMDFSGPILGIASILTLISFTISFILKYRVVFNE